jgi:starvation-inducible DNA-binding protein
MNKTLIDCNIGLTEETRFFVAQQLQILISDQYIIFTKLFKYHWNVYGPFFGPLHAFFKKGYELMYETIDQTAERSLKIGFFATGTLQEFLKYTRLSEEPEINHKAEIMIELLIKDFESLIIQIRELINQTDSTFKDIATNDFLVTIIERYEEYLWMLRSHINK